MFTCVSPLFTFEDLDLMSLLIEFQSAHFPASTAMNVSDVTLIHFQIGSCNLTALFLHLLLQVFRTLNHRNDNLTVVVYYLDQRDV